MGRVYEKWHICKCLVFHAENLVKVYTQKNSGYTKSRRKIRQQKIPKINSKFLHIEVLSREAWASKDTRFLTLSHGNLQMPLQSNVRLLTGHFLGYHYTYSNSHSGINTVKHCLWVCQVNCVSFLFFGG